MRDTSPCRFFSLLASVALCLCAANPAGAQSETISKEGVADHHDKKQRDPLLSVTTSSISGGVRISADAHIPNEDYNKYPIEFQFYVNRSLLASQIRSPELPGPVGIDVSSNVAVTPFNYAVVARVLHPNRHFTTVIIGAAFATNLTGALDCTFTAGSGDDFIFQTTDVGVTQSSNTTLGLRWSGVNSNSGSNESDLSLSLDVGSGGNSSGTIRYSIDDEPERSIAVAGSVETASGGGVTSIDVESRDKTVKLECSSPEVPEEEEAEPIE